MVLCLKTVISEWMWLRAEKMPVGVHVEVEVAVAEETSGIEVAEVVVVAEMTLEEALVVAVAVAGEAMMTEVVVVVVVDLVVTGNRGASEVAGQEVTMTVGETTGSKEVQVVAVADTTVAEWAARDETVTRAKISLS